VQDGGANRSAVWILVCDHDRRLGRKMPKYWRFPAQTMISTGEFAQIGHTAATR